jgi:prevent-host-death family protein
MKAICIADLKARLRKHLRSVCRGHSLTVLDRGTPVARIVPYSSEGSRLVLRKPSPGSPPLSQIPLPPRLKSGRDIVALLLEDRRRYR